MKPKRRPLGVALIAILALAGSLAVATNVLGKRTLTVIEDPKGDGGAVVPGTHPGFCNVIKATSKLARKRRVRHTVTVRGRLSGSPDTTPGVFIKKRWTPGAIGLPDFILLPGEPGVRSHRTNHGRTIVYYVKRRRIADAVDHRRKYYWVVDQCNIPDDRAPNHGSPSQTLKNSRHHGRHHHAHG